MSFEISRMIESYYAGKLLEHGASHRGADWNSASSQSMRFEQLVKILGTTTSFSLVDYGCGYGALVDYLDKAGLAFQYQGFDLAQEMVRAGQQRYPNRTDVTFSHRAREVDAADFCVASGIFNVRFDVPDDPWLAYIRTTLDQLDQLGRRGFAFNALTVYSDSDRMRGDLYYADPLMLFDYCKKRYSRRVALLHDYPLYEFTILVRKQEP